MDKYQEQPHLLDPHLGKHQLIIMIVHLQVTTGALYTMLPSVCGQPAEGVKRNQMKKKKEPDVAAHSCISSTVGLGRKDWKFQSILGNLVTCQSSFPN